MAIFNIKRDYKELDWNMLKHGATTLFYKQDILDETVEWMKKHNYIVHEFDCSKWNNETDFHTEIAKKLDFPGYYGKNLDAFNDCLSDIEVPEESGTVLVFLNFDSTANAKKFHKEFAKNVLSIIESSSRMLLLTGQRLIVCAQSNDPNISFQGTGAGYVRWNDKEWLKENRESK